MERRGIQRENFRKMQMDPWVLSRTMVSSDRSYYLRARKDLLERVKRNSALYSHKVTNWACLWPTLWNSGKSTQIELVQQWRILKPTDAAGLDAALDLPKKSSKQDMITIEQFLIVQWA